MNIPLCPLCKQTMLEQSPEDAGWGTPDWYCPQIITLSSGKKVNHYRVSTCPKEEIIMHLPPYRIQTQLTYLKHKKCYETISKIGLLSKYKTGKKLYYFKTILFLPEIHPDTEEKLRNRIKLLLLLS